MHADRPNARRSLALGLSAMHFDTDFPFYGVGILTFALAILALTQWDGRPSACLPIALTPELLALTSTSAPNPTGIRSASRLVFYLVRA